MKLSNTILLNESLLPSNKKAFTLAEVLITLTILGVVAAITIPSLVNRQGEVAARTKLKKAIANLFVLADKAYREGANILILSDRGVDEYHAAIPSLLAVSALQQHLVDTRKRTALAMVLESAEPRTVHHFAALLGYGACAVNPYLAHDTIKSLIKSNILDKDYYAAEFDYNHAILSGITKIASKMGISTIQSYQGSKIFEALGISKDVIDKYFTKTISPVGGYTLEDIAQAADKQHTKAFDPLGLSTDLTLNSLIIGLNRGTGSPPVLLKKTAGKRKIMLQLPKQEICGREDSYA